MQILPFLRKVSIQVAAACLFGYLATFDKVVSGTNIPPTPPPPPPPKRKKTWLALYDLYPTKYS